ncbi:MAG: hypothetical protein JXA54_11615 [Candidatus Heimdallarchaeota archaeon]|nr:hypothetical protein [Candidatus Heimdallarchaeota archaeon]
MISKKLQGKIAILVVVATLIAPALFNSNKGLAYGTIIATTPDGKGYLMELQPGKLLMHLEGTGYEMGFQAGYLDPESVVALASDDWFINVIKGLLSADDSLLVIIMRDVLNYNRLVSVLPSVPDAVLQANKAQTGDSLDDLLYKLLAICKVTSANNEHYVPQEYIDEMHGIVAGVAAAGYSVSYEYVRLLNMGMDAMLALAYPVVEPLLFWLNIFEFLSCSGFVVQGSATTTGHTYMGRHWQFTSYITKDHMLFQEFEPATGNRFLSTSCAGFVGATAAMNNQGIGIGNDMVPAGDCNPDNFGMGTLFTCRYVAQYANQLTEAKNFIQNSVRGCSWIYGIGDGRNGETGGMALETSAHYCYARTMSYTLPWYAFFADKQIESKSNVVTYTNHYIYYNMKSKADSTAITDSKDRYSWLTNAVLNVYGTINFDKATTLIDYLHPPNYDYYGSDLNQAVGCAVSSWDLTTLEARGLWGHYNDPWATYSL